MVNSTFGEFYHSSPFYGAFHLVTVQRAKRLSLLLTALLTTAFSWGQQLYVPELSEKELQSQTPIDSAAIRTADSTARANAPDTVEYRAEELEYDISNSVIRLNTNASIHYGKSKLEADTIAYSSKTMVVEAVGAPQLQDPGSPALTAYKMKYDLRRKIGELFYASAKQSNQQFNGMDIRRLPDERLQIARGDFSTCDSLENQHYYFYVRRMAMKPNQSMVAKPVVLDIADVPIAILPLMAAPLGTGRRSGLLTPKFGGDQSLGFYIENLGAYWAINDYMDLTASGDLIEGEKGTFDRTVAKSLFRYNKRYTLDGQLDYRWYLKEFDPDRSGWDLHFNHAQRLTPDGRTTLSGQGSFVSTNDVRQSNGIDRETVLDQQANATLTFRHQWRNNASLNVTASQERKLVPVNDELPLRRQLPDLSFSSGGALFDPSQSSDELTEPAWWEKISYNYSLRGNQYIRQTERAEEHPLGAGSSDTTWIGATNNLTLRYQGSLAKVFNVTPSLNWNNYWSDSEWDLTDSTRHSALEPTNGNFGTMANAFNAQLQTDTKLYGIWQPHWGRFTGIRHVISPSVAWVWAPEIDTVETMVLHPLIHPRSTYQEEQQSLRLALGNDFDLKYLSKESAQLARSGGDTLSNSLQKPRYEHLKILSLYTGTNYNFAKSDSNWSDLSSRLTLQFSNAYAFTINFGHTLYDSWGGGDPTEVVPPILKSWSYSFNRTFQWGGRFNSGMPQLLKGGEWTPWSTSLSYSYGMSAQRVSSEAFQKTESHSASASLSLQPTGAWRMSYATHYDFHGGRFAEHRFTFNRSLHCWNMNFTWTPVGPSSGWSFYVQVTDLPDIKLQAADRKSNYKY